MLREKNYVLGEKMETIKYAKGFEDELIKRKYLLQNESNQLFFLNIFDKLQGRLTDGRLYGQLDTGVREISRVCLKMASNKRTTRGRNKKCLEIGCGI